MHAQTHDMKESNQEEMNVQESRNVTSFQLGSYAGLDAERHTSQMKIQIDLYR